MWNLNTDTRRLDEDSIYEVLSSKRRRATINYLQKTNGSVEIDDLTTYIATLESTDSPPPESARKTVYVSLHQTHLPELDRLNIINYDKEEKTINVAESFQDVIVYLEVVGPRELSWSEFYLAIGVIGLLTFFAYALKAPLITDIGIQWWGLIYLFIVAVSGLYRTVTRRSI
ncbi:MAG: hypothetical protein ABEK59_08560 [Halobacteria archaeon]